MEKLTKIWRTAPVVVKPWGAGRVRLIATGMGLPLGAVVPKDGIQDKLDEWKKAYGVSRFRVEDIHGSYWIWVYTTFELVEPLDN